MRYPMRLDRMWKPFLWVLGGTPQRSFVDVEPERVRFKFGAGFDHNVPRSEIVSAERTSYPLFGGIGWRMGLVAKSAAIVGSTHGVVRVTFKAPRRVRMTGIPKQCQQLFVSLEDPDGFVRELAPTEKT
ncbi:MAG: hypothetical protein HY898_20395 [Deltaproteobacteria bacterium]|nr:hypothetical protein [Deltaproteobacteria bacterium]